MTHEPECRYAAYLNEKCLTCEAIRAAYRRGHNDHARAQALWEATHGGAEVHVHYIQQDTHGAHRPNLAQMRGSGSVSSPPGEWLTFNQHGEGTNP